MENMTGDELGTKESMSTHLLTMEDVKNIFHISKVTIYDWVKKGILAKPFKIGKKLYFRKLDIDATIEHHIIKSNEEQEGG